MQNFYQWIQLREVQNPKIDIISSPTGDNKYIRNQNHLKELLSNYDYYLEAIKKLSGLEDFNHRNQKFNNDIWSKIPVKVLMEDIRIQLDYKDPTQKLPNWRFGNEKLVSGGASYIDELENILQDYINHMKVIYNILKKYENAIPIEYDSSKHFYSYNSVKNAFDQNWGDKNRVLTVLDNLAYSLKHRDALLEHIKTIIKNSPPVEIEPQHYERFWKPHAG